MRKLFTILVAVLLTATLWAQTPEKMSYQAVIRNSSDALVTNTQIGMEINIRLGSETGTIVYTETQTPTTNANGLVSIEIGGGTGFNTINWASDDYFIETKTAVVAPLTTYTITDVSQLLSVPYALHAKTAENGITTAQADEIAANTLKVGITAQQASDITTNNAKVGYTDALVSANADVVANTAKISAAVGTAAGEMQYWNGTEWVTVVQGHENATLTFKNGIPTWVTIPIEVTNPTTGKIWMDRNLGASQVATSSTDADAYGDLYQWGRRTDGHQIRISGTTAILSTTDTPGHGNFITNGSDWRSAQNDNLWQGVSGTNNPCPAGYRLPTEAEWDAERTSWGSNNNSAGAFGSPLKLPVAGRRSYSGSLDNVGSYGRYWSGTVDGSGSRYLYFGSSFAYMDSNYRANGFSVRCLKD